MFSCRCRIFLRKAYVGHQSSRYMKRKNIQSNFHFDSNKPSSQNIKKSAEKVIEKASETVQSKESDDSFKEKGFAIPSDYLLKTKAEIPSLADLTSKGLNVIKPALLEITTKIRQNMPSDMSEVRRLLAACAPKVQQLIETAKQSTPDMNELKSTPVPAFTFGCMGIMPFIFPAWRFMGAGCILPGWEFFQLAYGACVLSFIGGIRWGAIMKDDNKYIKPDWPDLGLGIMPPLLAVTGLMFPPFLANVTLISGLSLALYIDLVTPGFPNWYKAFRLVLTAGAVFSLILTLLLKIFLPRKQTTN